MTDPIRRVAFVNWRLPSHPNAGGAERYVVEVARALERTGRWDVSLIGASGGGLPQGDGLAQVALGGTLSVYPLAAWYVFRSRGYWDAIVDCQNGIPFYLPLVAHHKTAVILLVHHVHQDQFGIHMRRAAAALGRILEGPVCQAVYRDRAVVAVSPSTTEEIARRLRLRGPRFVVPNAVRPLPGLRRKRSRFPRIVILGRVVAHKRVDLALEACALAVRQHPNLAVDVVGTGDELPRAVSAAARLGLAERTTFHGWVKAEKRTQLLSNGWIHLTASAGEGFGLTVLEAAAAGCPSVGFDVPGLRDSIVAHRTGWLAHASSNAQLLGDALADALTVLRTPVQYQYISENCRIWSESFSWDRSAQWMESVILTEIDRRSRRRTRERRRMRSDVVAIVGDVRSGAPTRLLRRTDRWARKESGTAIIFHGAGDLGARTGAKRAGMEVLATRAANTYDLLGASVLTAERFAGPTGTPATE